MGRIQQEIIIPKKLPAAGRQALTDALYAIQREVFDGVDREAFARYVVESKAERTWLQVHRDDTGKIGGYLALHAFERKLRGRPTIILRAEAGSLRQFRGGNTNISFLFKQILRVYLEDRSRPLYYLGCLVHPSSYALIAKFADEVWPHPSRELPADLGAFMCDLGGEFGLERVSKSNPLLRDVGWKTRDAEAEQNYWRTCDKPAARFFVQANPGYGEGHGMLTLVPLDGPVLTEGARRIAADRAQRWGSSAAAHIHRMPVGAQLLRPGEIRRLLRGAPLFSFLSDEHIDLLSRSAEIVSLPPGAHVFHENDFGDDLYLLARGAAYILKARGNEERILDQLSAGAIFGEIALLSSERRTASVRAATACTLVRLNRNALLPVLSAHPELRSALWKAFAERYFDNLTGATSRLRSMSRARRLEWFREGEHEEMDEGAETLLPAAVTLFLLKGQVEVQDRSGSWVVMRAPGIFDAASTMRVIAREPSYIVRLPDPLEDPLTLPVSMRG